MNTFVLLASVVAAAANGQVVEVRPAGYGPSTLVRAPAHDSASIESHRLGGNFAYSTAEAHAFAKTTPILSTAIHPVAETTHTHVPAPVATVHRAPIVQTNYAAKPVIGSRPVIAHQPVIGEVARHTKVTQPIYKTQTLVHQAAPVVAYQQQAIAAPVIAGQYAAGYAGQYAAGYAGQAYAGQYATGYAGLNAGLGYAGLNAELGYAGVNAGLVGLNGGYPVGYAGQGIAGPIAAGPGLAYAPVAAEY